MRKMKDSGIEWLSCIPKLWKIDKLKYHTVKIESGTSVNAGYSEASDDEIGVLKTSCVSKYKFDVHENKNVDINEIARVSCPVRGETIIVSRMNTPELVGACGYVDRDYNNIFLPDRLWQVSFDKSVFVKYMWYQLQSSFVRGYYSSLCTGSSSSMQNISQSQFESVSIILPALKDQKQIADYLDEKCTEIDSLVSDIQHQIETLEQYKRSVITEAVTKGLDSDVEMRDSGVQWIGMIPKHWTVDNPKWHFVQRKDRATKGLTQLTASQKYGVVTQEEYMEITGAKVVTVEKDFDILKLVCPGDFIIHMRSFQGGLEYSEKYGSISSAYVMLIPQKTILEPRFYKWFFKSPVYIDALSSTSNLIRDGQAMRYANFIQLPIPLMPKEEQQQIADYLDSKCAEIDSIIAEKKQQIETIEEYKKSLIFEYVTGKKEVII